MPKIVKGDHLGFLTSFFYQNIKKKLKVNLLETWKNFRLKKSKKIELCRKIEKKGTLWDFLTFISLQNMKKNEGGTLVQSKNFRKKSHGAGKK